MPDYYVYALIDPRNGKPFYIGKGKGDRVLAHEREAKKGSNSPKCLVIQDIWEDGMSVTRRILKRFAKESQAYKYEERLIKKIGLDNLTNLASGGQNPWRFKPDPGRSADLVYLVCYAKLRLILDKGWKPFVRWWGVEFDVPDDLVKLSLKRGEEVLKRRGLKWCTKNMPTIRVPANLVTG